MLYSNYKMAVHRLRVSLAGNSQIQWSLYLMKRLGKSAHPVLQDSVAWCSLPLYLSCSSAKCLFYFYFIFFCVCVCQLFAVLPMREVSSNSNERILLTEFLVRATVLRKHTQYPLVWKIILLFLFSQTVRKTTQRSNERKKERMKETEKDVLSDCVHVNNRNVPHSAMPR